MKKVYKKPVAVVECFELAEHIASCGDTTVGTGNMFGKPNHYSGSNCEFDMTAFGGGQMFLSTNGECDDYPVGVTDDGKIDMDGFESACYNTPDGIISMFAS